jgi:uncharacterized protein YcbX
MGDAVITGISTTPVKGLRLHARETVELGRLGVADNRVFFLIDAQHKLVNGKRVGELTAVSADYDLAEQRLSLTWPDGTRLSETVTDGTPVATKFFSRSPDATPVCPQLSAALSEFTGAALRLVRADPALTASDRGPASVVSLLSRGSLAHLGGLAGEAVDGRRFRMLFEVDGLTAHAEDAFVDQRVRVGSALVRFIGHVGRCRITSMDPDTGKVTLPTLDLLGYRRGLDTTEPLAFGIYGEVLEPGTVSLGDPVSLESAVAGSKASATELMQ